MFRRKSTAPKELQYDRENCQPVLKCSICTGEQVAGLKDIRTNRFEEVMLVRSQEDLEAFMRMCGVDEIKKEY